MSPVETKPSEPKGSGLKTDLASELECDGSVWLEAIDNVPE